MYDDVAYYFHKNLQGDVIEIRSAYGSLVARYTYDAWGKVISITNENGLDVTDNAAHVANANPFRYRGYYYDDEIGIYYLQSRYYDPVVGRYISADDIEMINGDNILSHNLYAYVSNNPTNDIDFSGFLSLKSILVYFQKISEVLEKAIDFILKRFGISKKNYTKRNQYKNKNDVYNFVYENRKSIKNIKKTARAMGKVIEILIVIVDYGKFFAKHSNEHLIMAEILFYGLIQFLCWGATELITFILTKIWAALLAFKKLIKNVLNHIFTKLCESSFVEKVKQHYLSHINTDGMRYIDFYVALTDGIYDAITT